MEFEILGPLHVRDGERDVEIGGVRQRTVLALLILRANEVVRTERLIDEVWGEHPPRNATAALHSHVSRLRKALGSDVLARREWGYVLRAPPDTIDVDRFERLLHEAEPLAARERGEMLRAALALWRGAPFADLASEPALQRDIARLEELRMSTLERRIDADLEAGRNADLVGELETLIAEHPLREHLRWQLILSLYRAGRQAEALEVYRETRRVLAEELGLDPSPELRELERAILRQDPTLRAARVPPIVPTEAPETRRRRWLAGGVVGGAFLAAGVLAALALGRADSAAQEGAGATVLVVTHTTSTEAPTTKPARPVARTRRHLHPTPTTTSVTTTDSTIASVTQETEQTAITSPASTRTTTTSRTATSPTTPTPRSTPGTARIVSITDSFDLDYVDPTIWHTITTDDHVSVSETDGRLLVTVGADARPTGQYNSIDAHVGTQCSFPGDFDARVDFELVEWPAADNVFVGLNAIYADSAVGRQFSPQWGDQYSSWVVPNGGSVPLPDVSGSLRITRVKAVETTYFLHRGAWQRLAVGTSHGSAVFGLQAMWFSNGGNAPFGGQEVKVAYDNFRVTGAEPICPPGSQLPGG